MTKQACFADIWTFDIVLCFFLPNFVIILILLPGSPATGDPLGIFQMFPSFKSLTNFNPCFSLHCIAMPAAGPSGSPWWPGRQLHSGSTTDILFPLPAAIFGNLICFTPCQTWQKSLHEFRSYCDEGLTDKFHFLRKPG